MARPCYYKPNRTKTNAKPIRVGVVLALSAQLLCLQPGSIAYAAGSAPPQLKAIDPSQAKMDALPKDTPPSPNPLGSISGAPISGDRQNVSLPPPSPNPTFGAPPSYSGAPAAGSYGAPPGYGAAPSYGAPYSQPGAPPGYGQAPAYGGPAGAPPSYGQPPYGGQPAYSGPPAGGGVYGAPPAYGSTPGMVPPNYGTAPGGAYPGNMAAPAGQPYAPPNQMYNYGAPAYGGAYAPPQQSYQPAAQPYGQPYNSAGMAPPSYGTAGPAPAPPVNFQQAFPPSSQPQMPTGRARFGGNPPPATYQPPGSAYQPPTGGPYQPQPGAYGPPNQPGYPPNSMQSTAPFPNQNQGPGPQGGMNEQPSFPSANLIPEFGKPLPLDASRRGPAQGWTANPPPPQGGGAFGGAPPGQDADEARVTRLEQLAFGSTYQEHEVVDRVDHLEKEIFNTNYSGDINSRLQRLESKLGGRGAFGPGRNQGSLLREQNAPNTLLRSDRSDASPADASASSMAAADSTASDASIADTSITSGTTASGMTAADGTASDTTAAAAGAPDLSSSDTASSASGDAGKQTTVLSSDTAAMVGETGGADGSSLSIPFDEHAGNYSEKIQSFAEGRAAIWTRFPVRVRFPENTPQEWRKQLESGMAKWGQYIPIKESSATERADIEVSWVNHLLPRIMGVTRLSVSGGRMKVQIFMLRPNYYQPSVSSKALAGAFLHELGHALGLFGHSDKPTDVMYAYEVIPGGRGKLTQGPIGELSARDLNTLKQIYTKQSLPGDFTLKTPMEWGLMEQPT